MRENSTEFESLGIDRGHPLGWITQVANSFQIFISLNHSSRGFWVMRKRRSWQKSLSGSSLVSPWPIIQREKRRGNEKEGLFESEEISSFFVAHFGRIPFHLGDRGLSWSRGRIKGQEGSSRGEKRNQLFQSVPWAHLPLSFALPLSIVLDWFASFFPSHFCSWRIKWDKEVRLGNQGPRNTQLT